MNGAAAVAVSTTTRRAAMPQSIIATNNHLIPRCVVKAKGRKIMLLVVENYVVVVYLICGNRKISKVTYYLYVA